MTFENATFGLILVCMRQSSTTKRYSQMLTELMGENLTSSVTFPRTLLTISETEEVVRYCIVRDVVFQYYPIT